MPYLCYGHTLIQKQMITKVKWRIWGGTLNLFTAILHTVGGQMTLINPLLQSDLNSQVETELLGVWHMATVMMFMTSFAFLYTKDPSAEDGNKELFLGIGYLYTFFALSFILSSIFNGVLAMQWVLLLPIGIIALFGAKRMKQVA